VLVVHQDVLDDMLVVVLIVDGDIYDLLAETVVLGLLFGLLNLHALDAPITVVLNHWLKIVDALGRKPRVAPLLEVEVLAHVLVLRCLLVVCLH
jgi:hypothetical protein